MNRLMIDYLTKQYKKPKMTPAYIFAYAEHDKELALLAQAYYMAQGDHLKANKYAKYTGRQYYSADQYVASDEKYAKMYKAYWAFQSDEKGTMRDMILIAMHEKNISMYQVGKQFNIPPSSLRIFFTGESSTVLSIEKVSAILKWVKSQ